MIEIKGNQVKIPAGQGYWLLSTYPWGGYFKRLTAEFNGQIHEVYQRYNNGSPKKFSVIFPDKTVGGFEI